MKRSQRIGIFSFALISFLQIAQAAPRFDESLKPFLNQSNDDSLIRVIALFKDAKPVKQSFYSSVSRLNVQRAMMENARLSQAETLRNLQRRSLSGLPIRTKSLWIINGAIIELPKSALKVLAQEKNIRKVSLDGEVKLIRPVRGTSSRSARFGAFADKYTYGLEKLQIPQLRTSNPNIDGKGVLVGVLDTGIDAEHPELKGRVIAFKDIISNKAEPYDDHGHGTHCAGTIGGVGASEFNIGVAPGVKYIIGKILNGNGSGTWAGVLSGMQYMADPDQNPSTNDAPRLVSNSWGGSGPSPKDPMDEPLCAAVSNWAKLGILPVFAAGNSGPSPKSVGLPGACPAAVTIGASDSEDKIASFSSRGPAVWKTGSFVKPIVVAPGVNVLSSLPKGKYAEWSGTSMATPHVAGLSALLFQVNPKADLETIVKVLRETSDKMEGDENTVGSGRVNALKAVQKMGMTVGHTSHRTRSSVLR